MPYSPIIHVTLRMCIHVHLFYPVTAATTAVALAAAAVTEAAVEAAAEAAAAVVVVVVGCGMEVGE